MIATRLPQAQSAANRAFSYNFAISSSKFSLNLPKNSVNILKNLVNILKNLVNFLKYLPSFFRKILKKKFDDCRRKLLYFKMYLKARDTGFRRSLNKKTLAGGAYKVLQSYHRRNTI